MQAIHPSFFVDFALTLQDIIYIITEFCVHRISVAGNPTECDIKMCWMKLGQSQGWLDWFQRSPPECVSHPNSQWEDVLLPCEGISKCWLLLSQTGKPKKNLCILICIFQVFKLHLHLTASA